MGAMEFDNAVERTPQTMTPKAAFKKAVGDALYNYGHAGYTGTIAEKENFVMIGPKAKSWAEAQERANDLMRADDPRIEDKWGPAGCIEVENTGWLFFGWASS